ncbi:hypothetical protein SEA_DRE3_65 [Gordonia phage Dre3]|uniref:Uncharacterized protein n=1 Tax=Gordonia phage Gibbous TaxID=2652405 RepID=A0A5J6T5S2_9CAUD|nr:hypothetical protein QLQ74_gp65 [Gordonia phage Gibbous]QFG05141.1 hypothetical protein SEA_GIBBOUS_65 [Gordonia phage Gibbous]QRI45994.1 hypothetical protein SEA_DRE3_65 [Gordonia phage Dre3]
MSLHDIMELADEAGHYVPEVEGDYRTTPSLQVEVVGEIGFAISLLNASEDKPVVFTTPVVEQFLTIGALVWSEGSGTLTMANGIWTLTVRGWVAGGIYSDNHLAFDLKEAERAERAVNQGVYSAPR